MNRRKVIVNSALGLAIAGVGLGVFLSVGAANTSPTAAAQTVTVSRGNLTASVTATGNAEAVTSIGVELEGSGGVVRKIYVKEGQKVSKGDKLLRIDDTAARQSLSSAKITLRSAQAGYETATQGQTAAELAQSNSSIASSRTSLSNAKTGLSQARSSYALDKTQQAKLVSIARKSVDLAEDQKNDDQSDLAAARRDLANATPGTTEYSTAQATVTSLISAVNSDTTAIISARNTLTQAKQSQDSTLLKDRQAIQTQSGQVDSAQDALDSQVAAANVSAQPARAGAVKSAQAQVDSAEVSVDQARETLAQTVLRAPAAGTVADISAVKGQSSSGSSSTADSSSGTDTTGSTSTTSSSASTTSGLVTLTDLEKKQIVASVAEADVTKMKVGQTSEVTFEATDTTMEGKVTAISTEDTVTNNVVTYDVTVTLDGKATAVRIGQSASLTITTGSAEDVLIAPTSAITTVGDRSTVTRRVNEVDSTVSVETGLVGTSGTEITSGLDAGDTLVVPTATGSTSNGFPGAGGLGGGLGGTR